MKWIPLRSKKDLPKDDSFEDYPKKYLVRVKGDDPRSGWVYVAYETAAQMKNLLQEDYAEYLDEDEDPNTFPTTEQITAALDQRYPYFDRKTYNRELNEQELEWANWWDRKKKEERTAFLDVLSWIKVAKFNK